MKKTLLISLMSFLTLLTFPCLAADKPTEQNSQEQEQHPMHVGALVGIGLPSLATAEGVFKYKDIVGVNAEVGLLPSISLQSASLHQEMFDVAGTVYPFRGDFYLSLGIGAQRLTATTSQVVRDIPADGKLQVNTVFLYPKLGLSHRFSFGLALGFDLGVELPLSGSVNTSSSVAGIEVPFPKGVSNIANDIKTSPIPVLHALKLGFLF